MKHISVLLNETIDSLNIKEDGIYVDCTLGYAGHSSAILKRLKKGMLYAFDQDQDARLASENTLRKISDNFEIIPTNFVNLKEELQKRGVTKVDGIMFDLGVSSPQLDDPYRGFSFHNDAKLDMRMDKNSPFSAYDVVNYYDEEKLRDVIKCFGEEKYAKSIAKKIVESRLNKKIETTFELVDIISSSVPSKYKRLTHPARRTFQAIRIEVNKELDILPKAINDAIDMLDFNGVISVITFHSLEDKICKDIFKKRSEVDDVYRGMPNIPEEYKPELKILKKVKPSASEIKENKRSRSATLRSAIKIRKG
ncbi:MAG: 16S rRNA (cytosine(1402)-N(4))-methyltransferase RsmH [Tenericutes bacterium]|nr:16S rRNA (cytosine(1402)-N(4))-methyltransferase RsmH [Mycoplasmatota bacterium]